MEEQETITTDSMTSEQAERIIELLENIDLNNAQSFLMIQDNMPIVFDTAKLISVYGFVYVPLVFIVIMLWWFFKQFIHKF